MQFLTIFSLLVLGFCGSSFAAPKDVTWTKNPFTFPYQRTVLSLPGLRIVGGDEARPNQFPYQVGLFVTKQLEQVFCGGSLISTRYVLTAAHCVSGAMYIQLAFGAHNISAGDESTRQGQSTSDYVVHPQYDSNALINDVALVKLGGAVTLNQYVQVVKLADGSDTYAGQQGTITGWGKTRDDQLVVTDILRYANNNILSNVQCKAAGSEYDAIIQDVHICLSGEGNKGICQGDSGGPLVAGGIQVGVTSFSYRSCEASKPSVFVRLTKFSDWIKANSDVNF